MTLNLHDKGSMGMLNSARLTSLPVQEERTKSNSKPRQQAHTKNFLKRNKQMVEERITTAGRRARIEALVKKQSSKNLALFSEY